MRDKSAAALLLAVGFCISIPVLGQSGSETTTTDQKAVRKANHQGRSPGGDVASGTADVGKGAAKGAGNAAKGAGQGAVDLVTLHPIDAAASAGKGAGSAGKDVAVGTTKGTGKIIKGIGRGIKHLF